MDNIKDFPKKIVVPVEADHWRHELRLTIQKVQSAYLQLKEDDDFVLPSRFEDLTSNYSRTFYQRYIQHIKEDFTLEDEQRKKLLDRWTYYQRQTTGRVNTIVNGISSTAALQWQFDTKIKMPVPGASVDVVANMLAERSLDPKAAIHYELIQRAAEAYLNLREWEASHDVARKPFSWLIRCPMQILAEEWAAGCFTLATAPDAITAEKWKIVQQNIF